MAQPPRKEGKILPKLTRKKERVEERKQGLDGPIRVPLTII